MFLDNSHTPRAMILSSIAYSVNGRLEMIYVIVVLLALTAYLMWLCLGELQRIADAVENNTLEVKELRLKSRARVGQASMRSGAADEVDQLNRLGRASVAQRVVVGGDDDSTQKKNLKKATQGNIVRRSKDGD